MNVAPIETKSSEALAAEEMTFESFCECLRRKRRDEVPQFDGEAVLVAGPDAAVSESCRPIVVL